MLGRFLPGWFKREAGRTEKFDAVFWSEVASINKRRPKGSEVDTVPSSVPKASSEKRGVRADNKIVIENQVFDTVGLALSGGGVRSAAFCMGVLQSLESAHALKRIDYLSTVSGGGYIGSSLTAGLHRQKAGDKPEAMILGSKIGDPETANVLHIRDYSNYLIPHGLSDVLQSIAIYLRGIAANFLIVFPWLLFFAAFTIWINPTRASLSEAKFLFQSLPDPFGIGHFVVTIYLAVILGAVLVCWALWRSYKRYDERPEVPNGWALSLGAYLVFIAIVAFGEMQPWVLDALFRFGDSQKDSGSVTVGAYFVGLLQYLAVILVPIATVVGAYASKLDFLIKRAAESTGFRSWTIAIASRIALYVAALAVPILLWVIYLDLSYWGVANSVTPIFAAPKWLLDASTWLHQFEERVVLNLLSWFASEQSWLFTQAQYFFYRLPVVTLTYLHIWILLFVASMFLAPNANALHRLYRDRLSRAFIVEPKAKVVKPDEVIKTVDRIKLSKLSEEAGPYHLINTALNLQASKVANRRGRDADFFVFSRNFSGSEATGYVKTASLEEKVSEIDLATAMAVSGAAASANMGSSSIKPLTPTLAFLNVRLGFWMRNPKFLLGQSKAMERLHYLLNPYFLYELFWRLSEKRWFTYLTDGGHVENLGIYELLKRRCHLIIAVDAEADPAMNFNSFVQVQRYARIDHGVRIELPWREIRDVTLDTGRLIQGTGGPGIAVERTGPHCAVGTIYYPVGGDKVREGLIVYVKSSMSGDESDYVIDYKRRYPDFPHETTGDQFFSEEQFEVYRALGFHAMAGLLSDRDAAATVTGRQLGTGSGRSKAKSVDPLVKNVQKILKASAPDVLPTVAFVAPPTVAGQSTPPPQV